MEAVEIFLRKARDSDLISPAQLSALLELNRAPPAGIAAELDLPADDGPPTAAEAAESPRFVRGFHDVLITIGVVAALAGLWGLATAWAVLPAVVFLAEILVRRQRLALPAVALTATFSGAAFVALLPIAGTLGGGGERPASATLLFFALVAPILAFWWRYRVPVALATAIAAIVAAVFSLALVGLQQVTAATAISKSHPFAVAATGLVFAGALFAVAMAFDVRDRLRLTRRSDVAFWLHLAAAPALMFALFAAIFSSSSGLGFWWAENPGLREALVAVGVVAVMMLVGIVIDRRAFVTSGLISLGVAVAVLAKSAEIDASAFATLPLFAVGVIVLLLGTGWQALRRQIVAILPQAIAARVPPAR
jgi:hypothetical protein